MVNGTNYPVRLYDGNNVEAKQTLLKWNNSIQVDNVLNIIKFLGGSEAFCSLNDFLMQIFPQQNKVERQVTTKINVIPFTLSNSAALLYHSLGNTL